MRFCKPEWHDRLTSTNSVLKGRLDSGERQPSGSVLGAREQTAGRGRYDRRWVSRPGRDLTFSFVLATQAETARLSSLSMAVALGIAEALDGYRLEPQLKWPNDVLVDGCKICGILPELVQPCPGHRQAAVVGVGLNVNMEGHAAAAIDRPATSILIETGQEHRVESVLDGLLPVLGVWLDRWDSGGFPALHDAWLSRHCALGDRVSVGEGDLRREGTLAGFGREGQLLLREEDGQIREIWAGDVGML
jgi:BirA family biotin operon repressor/biotin-[acetyl-CoA-carboxylase] ligase